MFDDNREAEAAVMRHERVTSRRASAVTPAAGLYVIEDCDPARDPAHGGVALFDDVVVYSYSIMPVGTVLFVSGFKHTNEYDSTFYYAVGSGALHGWVHRGDFRYMRRP